VARYFFSPFEKLSPALANPGNSSSIFKLSESTTPSPQAPDGTPQAPAHLPDHHFELPREPIRRARAEFSPRIFRFAACVKLRVAVPVAGVPRYLEPRGLDLPLWAAIASRSEPNTMADSRPGFQKLTQNVRRHGGEVIIAGGQRRPQLGVAFRWGPTSWA